MVIPVLVALDFSDLDRARTLAARLKPSVGGYKVGLQLLMSEGPRAVTEIARLGLPVFADVKLHDIPNTVRGAATAMSGAGARWITVHASGGTRMLEAAAEGMAGASAGGSGVLAVTVLTSLDGDDLISVGIAETVSQRVSRLADLSSRQGAEGVICSPHEVPVVKSVSPDLLAVTPGIRLSGDQAGDQRRTSTPEAAVGLGADLLVVGRSITASNDPEAVVAAIAESLAHNLR